MAPSLSTPGLGNPSLGTPVQGTPGLDTPGLGTPGPGTPILGTPGLGTLSARSNSLQTWPHPTFLANAVRPSSSQVYRLTKANKSPSDEPSYYLIHAMSLYKKRFKVSTRAVSYFLLNLY